VAVWARTPRAARRGRGAAGRATSHSGAKLFHCALACPRVSPYFEIEMHQGVNREVVDLTTLYNFHQGRMVFFSTDFAQIVAKF
jgi:hypothetical protein